MALKTYNPTTPSQRELVLVDRSHLWKGKPVKALTEGLTKSGGRNNHGRVTMWHRGGGHKRTYRKVDFKRGKLGVPATVERLEYDPNRTAFIALVKYEDGELSYILAPQRLAPGDTVIADTKVDVKPGNAMPLANMPIGTIITTSSPSTRYVRPGCLRKNKNSATITPTMPPWKAMPPFQTAMMFNGFVRYIEASCLLMMSLMTKNVRPPTSTPTSA
jgi:hypothetical protein